MLIQLYKTHCEDCGEEVESRIGVISDGEESNEIIIDFIDEMEFHCECGTTTVVQVEKYTRS